ncbi:unnamed protein product [Penicillium egyptiacum]|uniref:NACHT domain-containing protein n=1 Tax=Penicillium egyptiacum TaxID=1303716 RepID=A0A9W4K404_9EURO|nr:unnamed protein product [Penicillium egyptiacum]
MSFGFGIGDFLAVIKLANETRKAFVEAPVQFKSISDEVRSLSLVLQDVEIDISAKELNSQQQAELNELLTGCHEVLADILKKIDDYTELSTTNDGKRNMAKRVWKRLKWEPSDVQELRLRINTNIALLTAFNGQIMKRSVAKLVQQQDEEARQKVLDWLSPSNYATQQSDYISRREQSTGQWFLDSSEFKDWISGSKQTLFCPGIPGAGKTILASIVVDELYDRLGSGGEVAIAYLYCSFMRHEEQSAAGLLSSLLKQVAQSQSSLPSSIREIYTKHTAKETRPSIGELSKAIQLLSEQSNLAKVYVVIDALDECRMNDGSRTRFLDAIFELQDACNINLLATSRFIPEITEKFKEKPELEIRASTADVMRYLRGNLPMLPAFVSRKPELQTEISTEITRAVDGMFLLAQLYLNSLVGKRSPKAIRSALKDISSGTKQYDSAYHDAMKRIEGQVSDQRELAMQVLAWITCAKKPLTTVELQTALGVEINESDFDEDNVPDLIDMVSVCAGLVTIDEQSNIIRLVHYTTQEFFQRNRSTWFPKANYDIGSICMAYLSYDTFKTHCQTVEAFTSRLERYPFGPYAAVFWGSHIQEREADADQPISDEDIIALLLDRPKLDSGMQFVLSTWPGIDYARFCSFDMKFGRRRYPTMGLHLAAYLGLSDVTRKLISLGSSVDGVDSVGKAPLSWAARHNLLDAITLLLAHGADPNIKDSRGRTPLFLAARGGHERAVQLLLEANCDLMSSNDGGQSALHASARGGSDQVARLLLMQGLNAHQKDKYGNTPLLEAARWGHLNLVQLFLDWDPDADPQDIQLNASIFVAVRYSNGEILRFLLDRGVDPNIVDWSGATPLICASMSGATSAIQVLLKWGVELEIKDYEGRTALSWAATCLSTEVVQLLLEHGSDINTEDNLGRGVVFYAAWGNAYTNLAALLTSTKIRNIHQPDRYGQTTIHVAASRGHLQSVVTLLESDGVELEIKDHAGQTALSWAASHKNTKVLQLLLKHGADVDTEDNLGRGVVFYAASGNAYTNLAALFTSTNIRNIHQPDRYGRTPLHVAATLGHLQSVLMLLESNDVDCEAQDEFGRTALSDAIVRKRFDVVKVLKPFSETESQVTVESVLEPTSQRDTIKNCDVCMADVLEGEAFYHCDTCNGADFDTCELCYHVGARCLERSHEMKLGRW